MIIISYDIKDQKLRAKFSPFLMKSGCIRLQFSVYELNNTSRAIDIIKENIKSKYSKLFTPDDSVVIFTAPNAQVEKYGNAIHRDSDLLAF